MKKYVLFFISIGVILGAILIFNVAHVEESKKETFSESGYILNGSTNRYYFYQDETYTTSYNKQIVFYDTEGTKVTIDDSNFIHYTSGNIVALQESVLLDLSKINDNPIVYYDVAANKEIKKISNRYSVKNLDSDLQFEQAIWKVSANKYIILANKLKITLNNGMTKDVDGYVEIEYSDNEIVNIYNQEFSYQTISSNSYIELQNNIKINLGTKIVSQNDENKMALEDMVINSNDNVTLVDLKPEKEENTTNETENTNETTDENQTTQNNIQVANGGSTSSTTTTSSSTSSSTTVVANNSVGGTTENDEKNKINIETPNILYEYVNDNESKVDETAAINEPKFKLENMSTTAVGLQGNIQITDDIKLPILGIYKDGIMTLYGLDIVLKDIKDTSIININSNNYYYSKECFIKANKISNNSVIKCLSLLKDNKEYANNYFTEVQSIIYNSTHNTKKEEASVKSKKVRAINPYKNNPKVKSLNQKPLSRKKKKELKKASNS